LGKRTGKKTHRVGGKAEGTHPEGEKLVTIVGGS